MGSGQEWWSHKASEELSRWEAFKLAHRIELEQLYSSDTSGGTQGAYLNRLRELSAEFEAAERVRKELEQRPMNGVGRDASGD